DQVGPFIPARRDPSQRHEPLNAVGANQIAGGPHQPRINGDAISFVRVLLSLLHGCAVVDVLVASVAVANLPGLRWLQLLPLLRALEVKPKFAILDLRLVELASHSGAMAARNSRRRACNLARVG